MTSKVIIITGASRGIGLAVAKWLLNASHRVVVTARTRDALESLKATYPGRVEYVAGDITDPQIAKQLTNVAVESFGQLDGLVVNHGALAPIARVGNADVDEWKRLYDINFFSALGLLKEALPELRKSKGCVAWVSSGAAMSCYTAWGAYGSSKAALHSLTGHVAVEEPDVTSVSFSPGRVDTDMQRLIREAGSEMKPSDLQDFKEVFERGDLLKPEVPGHTIARFVVNPQRDLTGKFLKVTGPELAPFRDE